jgi:hypothetical protein
MPSKTTASMGYRKAKCCEACTHQKNGYCGVLLMRVNPSYVCNTYFGAAGRAARKTLCKECVFGPNGDKSCAKGFEDKHGRQSCFSGRKIPRRLKKNVEKESQA